MNLNQEEPIDERTALPIDEELYLQVENTLQELSFDAQPSESQSAEAQLENYVELYYSPETAKFVYQSHERLQTEPVLPRDGEHLCVRIYATTGR